MEPTESMTGGDVADIRDGGARAAAPAALFNRNFVLLWTGQAVSQLGNRAYGIAMNLWLMERTGSATLMGLLLTFSALPGVLLGPFGGTFADRHSRIRILVACDLIAGLGVGVLAFTLWARPDATQLLIGLVFAVGLLLGVISAY
ncbi:MAG TPA: MFS transporter, partial [Thermoanaerobaculia bacterium]